MDMKWLVKQILPLTYVSEYGDLNGNKYVSVWRMWFGKVINHKIWEVV